MAKIKGSTYTIKKGVRCRTGKKVTMKNGRITSVKGITCFRGLNDQQDFTDKKIKINNKSLKIESFADIIFLEAK